MVPGGQGAGRAPPGSAPPLLLAGEPIGRIVGGEAMKFGWQRLNAEYAKQFGVEAPDSPPEAPPSSE